MPVIKPSCIRDLKLRVNLADVVSRVVALKKAGGAKLKGLCPFHNEKTPSFNVDAEKGYYKCFGCGKAGDAITFVRETEQLSFTEAIEALGQRFGIPIEYEEGSGPSKEERSLRQELFDLHDEAAAHFHDSFKAQSSAGEFMRAYWVNERRFTPELAEEFKIGVAASDGGGLGAAIMRKKYSEDALRQCGLFFIRDDAMITVGALRPRFRGRLMIPIRDHQGRVVAFTARQTKLTPDDDPAKEAKYVNSPETPIFTKGNLLFNLDRASKAVGDGKPFVMVEGQLDALRCWSVGLKTAVAPQGTSITDGQLSLLKRYKPQVECFFDSDSAGQKASLRMLPMALKAEIEVRFLTLEGASKLDPDLLFLEKGLWAYEDVRKSSLSAMAFACKACLPSPASASSEERSRAAQAVLAIIAAAESEISRASFINEAAALLQLPAHALQSDLRRLVGRQERNAPPPKAPTASELPKAQGAVAPEHDLLRLCLHYEELGRPMSSAIPHDWIDQRLPEGVLLNRFLGEFENGNWPGKDHLEELTETDHEKSLVASLLFDVPRADDPAKAAREGIHKLRTRVLGGRIRQIELALANTPSDFNDDSSSLLREFRDLQRQLRQPVLLTEVG
ncbi:MAG TPA: DNA primase [Opitutaceae bacterium]|nr:DNA primase [Opitutaceae bacterium]